MGKPAVIITKSARTACVFQIILEAMLAKGCVSSLCEEIIDVDAEPPDHYSQSGISHSIMK
ncbi:hypothetical protein CCR94_14185 [Rhodoblastus sphagnicola]|uniref:Uncharacterized protein n=1 Tax=Rhodoblastus sphagnicola TaxID=333368 RepID=A0A2S6N5A1_9HYPH|nr:hypothetical protein CCR94_14185 [Rhodoblastus sphagnicola]